MGNENLPGRYRGSLLTSSQILTAQFYDWEKRGRGWHLWDYPVELEPAFIPFLGHHLPAEAYSDDARIETIGSRISSWFKSHPEREEPLHIELEEYEPELFYPNTLPSELTLAVPPEFASSIEKTKAFLKSIPAVPLSFEIVGSAESIRIQISSFAPKERLRGYVRSFYPGVTLSQPENSLEEVWDSEGEHFIVIDMGLSEEFMLPIEIVSSLETDPYIPLLAVLDSLKNDEVGVVQIVCSPTRYPWLESAQRAVSTQSGKSFLQDAPYIQKGAISKLSSPLFAVSLRLGVKAHSPERIREIAQLLVRAFDQFAVPGGNRFIPLTNDGYDDALHELDFLSRTTHRSGMLLSLDELTGLLHLPSPSVRSEKLLRETRRTKRAPQIAIGNELTLGDNYHDGESNSASLSQEQRTQHTHIIGASGTGKSHLLVSMIAQDMKNGHGLAVLDPHGDLIDRAIQFIPQRRLSDVILIDPSDEDYPVGLNILSATSTLEQELLAADMVAIFKSLATSWGDQMTSVLGNALLAILTSKEGGTLRDLRRFLVEKRFRHAFLKSVEDEEIRYFWEHEYPLLSGRPQAPLLTRLDSFLRPRLIRRMVSQKEKTLDLPECMNEGKIVFIKLAHGLIGEENAYFLGALLVSRFYQSALGRQSVHESQRRPFFLYLDEFHHFLTPSLKTLLSGARKYALGLTLAHQGLDQIKERDRALLGSLLTNPYTRIAFRVGERDAKTLSQGYGYFEDGDIQNLGRGEALVRVERKNYDFNVETRALPEVDRREAETLRRNVVAFTRAQYATPKDEVDHFLASTRPQTRSREEPPATDAQPHEPHVDESPPPSPPQPKATAPRDVQAPSKHLGRGGKQHIYLQSLLQRYAEGLGIRASIEEALPEGGSVDVVLHSEEKRIACEISITTSPEHELGNVEKCLNAGFDVVVLVCPNAKRLGQLKEYISEKFPDSEHKKVHFLSPEAFFEFVDGLPNSRSEKVVGGYKVQVEFDTPEEEEIEARRKALSRIVHEAMKKMKGK